MTNHDKLKNLLEQYSEQIDANDFAEFAVSVIEKCGAVAFRKIAGLFSEEGLSMDLSAYIKPYYTVEDDVVYSADKKRLVKYAPEKTDARYEMPASVEYIECEAFEGNGHLTEIVWGRPSRSGIQPFINCPQLKTIRTNNIHDLLRYCCSDIIGSPFINGADLYIHDTLCETLVLPEGAIYANPCMFEGCTSIKHVQSNADNRNIAEAILDVLNRKK